MAAGLSQGFLTGVLQTFARKYAIPIDTLNFGFEVRSEWTVEEIENPADDGVLVNGLFTDGARWNEEKVCTRNPNKHARVSE